MNQNRFLEEIRRIFQIAFIQKVVFLILRAAWVGGAVYILCWGANQLWGLIPNQRSWLVIALSVSMLIISSIFIVTKPSKKFVWKLDRGFSLHEQVFTLYEAIQDGGSEAAMQPGVQPLFESHDIAQLPEIRRELVDKGWRVKEEFEATLVVLILLLIVYLTSVSSIIHIPTAVEIDILPPLAVDPSAEEVFANGIPGSQVVGQGTAFSTEGIEGVGLPDQLDLSPLEWAQVTQLMRELGDNLSQESGTYELGQALSQENYKKAGTHFSNLAENIENLTKEVQTRIASHFLDTAVSLQNLQQSRISSYFQEASAALYEGSPGRISHEIDDLADLMEFFSQFQAREMRADLNTDLLTATQQSLDLFQNEAFVIEAVDNLPDYASSPNVSETAGEEIFGESLDFIAPFDSNIIEGVWFPFQYSQEDSDVVSSYFSPR